MLSSQEIGTLITALGTGIGKDEFNPDKLRYHKIIIMTDADVDGAHIRTLLLTFFFRQMPELIERGHLYIAQPPLYKVSRGKSSQYLKDEKAMEDYLTENGGFRFERMVRGVKESVHLDAGLIGSQDARMIDQMNAKLRDVYTEPPVLRRKEGGLQISGPRELLDAVFSVGRKGLALQRYKGLGEMNAEQLWETTLDPNARSLLQVRVNDAVDADSLFSRLMGDEVEPRREFIQDNALSVANLDI
jgi:DNA gyrase/topoisomerase IV subunit B